MENAFYILRHCEAHGQDENADLTVKGYNQAKRLSSQLDKLKINKIVSSYFKRAIYSIQPFSILTGIKIELSQALIERSFGDINSSDESYIAEKAFYNPNFTTNNGLSNNKAIKQALLIIDNALKDKKNTYIFVSHGYLIGILLNHFDNDFKYDDFLKLKRPDLIRVIFDNSKFTIKKIDLHK